MKFELKDEVQVRRNRRQLSHVAAGACATHLTLRRRHVRHPVTDRVARRRFGLVLVFACISASGGDGEASSHAGESPIPRYLPWTPLRC